MLWGLAAPLLSESYFYGQTEPSGKHRRVHLIAAYVALATDLIHACRHARAYGCVREHTCLQA